MLQQRCTLRTLCYVKAASHKKDKYCMTPPIRGTKVVKFMETERMVVTRRCGEEERGSCLMDIKFQICKMEKF